jgi:K+-transporting ATPase KdpF subunit
LTAIPAGVASGYGRHLPAGHGRDVRVAGVARARDGPSMTSDIVGLIIAIVLVMYLVAALLFPERF